MQISYKDQNLKEHMKKLIIPEFMRIYKNDQEFMNWLNTSLAYFVTTTVMRSMPQYTWIDLPVPDQFNKYIGMNLTFDYSDQRKIRIYH